jgi:hypothetical protein
MTSMHPENPVWSSGRRTVKCNKSFDVRAIGFVHIPAHSCLNLSAVVNVVLAHRSMLRSSGNGTPAAASRDVARGPGRGSASGNGCGGMEKQVEIGKFRRWLEERRYFAKPKTRRVASPVGHHSCWENVAAKQELLENRLPSLSFHLPGEY